MGLKGFIGGALSSAGKTGLDIFARQQESEIRMGEAKEKLKMMTEAENASRQAKADRLNSARDGIVSSVMSGKYAESDAAASAAERGETDSTLTLEQKRVIDEAKSKDKSSMSKDPTILAEAGMKTGDMDFKEYAAIISQERASRIKERQQTWKESVDERRLDQGDRKLEQGDRRLDSILANIGRSQGSQAQSAFVQGINKLMELGKTKDEAINIMTSAKTPVESYVEKTEDDGFTKKVATTKKGPVKPAQEMDPNMDFNSVLKGMKNK